MAEKWIAASPGKWTEKWLKNGQKSFLLLLSHFRVIFPFSGLFFPHFAGEAEIHLPAIVPGFGTKARKCGTAGFNPAATIAPPGGNKSPTGVPGRAMTIFEEELLSSLPLTPKSTICQRRIEINISVVDSRSCGSSSGYPTLYSTPSTYSLLPPFSLAGQRLSPKAVELSNSTT